MAFVASGHHHAVAQGPSRDDQGIGAGISETASCESRNSKTRLPSSHLCSFKGLAFRPKREPRGPPLRSVFIPHAARIFAAAGNRPLVVATMASAVSVGISGAAVM